MKLLNHSECWTAFKFCCMKSLSLPRDFGAPLEFFDFFSSLSLDLIEESDCWGAVSWSSPVSPTYKTLDRDTVFVLYKLFNKNICVHNLTTRTRLENAESGFLNDLCHKSRAPLVKSSGIEFCFLSEESFLYQGFLYRVVYCKPFNIICRSN